jgi:hypothetical protein
MPALIAASTSSSPSGAACSPKLIGEGGRIVRRRLLSPAFRLSRPVVIASEAKQSSSSGTSTEDLDCFVAFGSSQ